MPVGCLDLAALILDFPEQPRVLDRQSRLGREGLKQVHDFRRKVASLLPPHRQRTHNLVLAEKGNCQHGSIPEPCKHRPQPSTGVFPLILSIRNLHRCPNNRCSPGSALTDTYRRSAKSLHQSFFHTVTGPQEKPFRSLIILVDNTTTSSGELHGMTNNAVEHRLEIESRADRLTDLTQSSQLPNRLRQLARSRLQFLEQPYVLNGDHCLVGEGFEECDLLLREGSNLRAPDQNSANRKPFSL